MGASLKDITGQRFGRVVVTRRAGSLSNKVTTWLVKCDCGNEKVMRADVLRNGTGQSCGCLARELSSARNRTHGCSYHKTPEYLAWCGMRSRCYCETNKDFPSYGGRDIFVCPEWDDFSVFLADMGTRPTEHHSLDRIDVNGPYCKANCRWATHSEQMLNRRPFTWTEERINYDKQTKVILDSI